MDRLWQDIRYGARLLVRFPGVTAAALLALALGTGVNTALFSVVNTVLLQPLPFPDSHELVQLWRTEPPSLQYGAASYTRYTEWRARNRVFEETGAWAPAGITLTGREAPERLPGARASASFFRVMGAAPVVGRWFTDEEDRNAANVVVLGESYWRQRLGGSPAVLGSTLMLDGAPHTVVGVAPAAYAEVWRFDAWVPIPMASRSAPGNFLQVFGRLRDGVTLEQARAGLADLAAEMTRLDANERYGFNALAVHDVLTRGPRQALWILLGTTGFVLLIACANVANLLLARAVTRQREMAVRTALGAGRGRLLRQLVTETLLLALIGGALGVLLATGLLRLFALLAPANFPRLASIELDTTVLLFSSATALLCGFLAGVLPGMQVSRAEPSDALREGSLARRHRGPRAHDEPAARHERGRARRHARRGGRIDGEEPAAAHASGSRPRHRQRPHVCRHAADERATASRIAGSRAPLAVLSHLRGTGASAARSRERRGDQHAADRADRHQRPGLSPRSSIEARRSAHRRVPHRDADLLRGGGDPFARRPHARRARRVRSRAGRGHQRDHGAHALAR